MRALIVLLIIVLLVFKFWPEQPTLAIEDTFIGPQLEPLRKAEQVEQQYLDALQKKNEHIERESDGG
jgi:hypothetical protein